MKVIKQGRELTPQERRIKTCTKCGCVFEYDPIDVKIVGNKQQVVCPNSTCQHPIIIGTIDEVGKFV